MLHIIRCLTCGKDSIKEGWSHLEVVLTQNPCPTCHNDTGLKGKFFFCSVQCLQEWLNGKTFIGIKTDYMFPKMVGDPYRGIVTQCSEQTDEAPKNET